MLQIKTRESLSHWCVMQDGEQMIENNVPTCVQFFVWMPQCLFPECWSPLREALEAIPLFLCIPQLAAILILRLAKMEQMIRPTSKGGSYVTVTTKACGIKKLCLNSWATSLNRCRILNTSSCFPSKPHVQKKIKRKMPSKLYVIMWNDVGKK